MLRRASRDAGLARYQPLQESRDASTPSGRFSGALPGSSSWQGRRYCLLSGWLRCRGRSCRLAWMPVESRSAASAGGLPKILAREDRAVGDGVSGDMFSGRRSAAARWGAPTLRRNDEKYSDIHEDRFTLRSEVAINRRGLSEQRVSSD